MRVAIVGVGAIGAVAALGFERAGWSVALVDNAADHVEAIRRHGLAIEQANSVDRIHSAALAPHELTGDLDLIAVATKSQHTLQALDGVGSYLDSTTPILSLQNGLNITAISHRVGVNRTLGAFVNFQAAYVEPGRVRCGREGSLYVGEVSGAETERARRIQEALQHVRTTTLTTNIQGFLWAKMAYAGILISSALVDAPVYESLERYPDVMQAVAAEVVVVAIASGVEMESFDFVQPMKFLEERYDFSMMITDWRARQIPYTGIWRDIVVRKRPTEVGAQMGSIVTNAAAQGYQMPLNHRLVKMISEIERGERSLGWSNFEELQTILKGRWLR